MIHQSQRSFENDYKCLAQSNEDLVKKKEKKNSLKFNWEKIYWQQITMESKQNIWPLQ